MPKRDFSGWGGGGGGGHFSKQPLVIEPVRHSVSKGLMLISFSSYFFRVVLLYNKSLFVLLNFIVILRSKLTSP